VFLTFRIELLGKTSLIAFVPDLHQKVEKIDQVVQCFDPSDHLPIRIEGTIQVLRKKAKIVHWKVELIREIRIVMRDVSAKPTQETAHRLTEFDLQASKLRRVEQRHYHSSMNETATVPERGGGRKERLERF
jgi:hypothetical protein